MSVFYAIENQTQGIKPSTFLSGAPYITLPCTLKRITSGLFNLDSIKPSFWVYCKSDYCRNWSSTEWERFSNHLPNGRQYVALLGNHIASKYFVVSNCLLLPPTRLRLLSRVSNIMERITCRETQLILFLFIFRLIQPVLLLCLISPSLARGWSLTRVEYSRQGQLVAETWIGVSERERGVCCVGRQKS